MDRSAERIHPPSDNVPVVDGDRISFPLNAGSRETGEDLVECPGCVIEPGAETICFSINRRERRLFALETVAAGIHDA